jgi:hypothetical protein
MSLEDQGHKQPCYYCGNLCNSLTGRPSLWPIPLCHADEPGLVKWHHIGCVSERLEQNEARGEAIRQIANGCEDPMDVAHIVLHHACTRES